MASQAKLVPTVKTDIEDSGVFDVVGNETRGTHTTETLKEESGAVYEIAHTQNGKAIRILQVDEEIWNRYVSSIKNAVISVERLKGYYISNDLDVLLDLVKAMYLDCKYMPNLNSARIAEINNILMPIMLVVSDLLKHTTQEDTEELADFYQNARLRIDRLMSEPSYLGKMVN